MIEIIEQSTQSLIVTVAAITAVGVFGMKSTELVSSRWLPVASIVLGATIGLVIGKYYNEPFVGIVDGILAGGFASGAYDFVKSVFRIGKDDN